jgi:hypothetical protein
MKYNSENGRKTLRLKGYDYSRKGLYFLTIVLQNRYHLFGRVVDGEMILNDAGKMVEKWYYEIENKYPDKRCHEMVIMLNHFHCIIENLELDVHVPKRWAIPKIHPNTECITKNTAQPFPMFWIGSKQ